MYISNMTHFLDETGNIPTDSPKAAREFAIFHAQVVDVATKGFFTEQTSNVLRCFRKKCSGIIECEILINEEDERIHWKCPTCSNEGLISQWQTTKWDNSNSIPPLDPEYDFKKLPKATREFTSFLNLIIAETLENFPTEFTLTYIRCHKKGCHGVISTMIEPDDNEIFWKCSDCTTNGNIRNT